MSERPSTGHLQRFARAARAAGRRQRLNAALRRLARLLPLPLGYAAMALALMKWAAPTEALEHVLAYGFVAVLLIPIVGVVQCWLSRRGSQAGALALDRHHGSADRITNALSFAALPPADRSPFMQAAIADALMAVERPSAARAVPLELPRAGWASVALGLGVLLISRIPTHSDLAPASVPGLLPVVTDPVALSDDDLALLRESAQAFEPAHSDPELTQSVSAFNQLVEDIAQRRLDRRELFRRLAEIERSLAAGSEADAALETGLRDLAEHLDKSALSRPIAKALEEQRLPDAERALRELAKRLTRQEDTINPAELERLRKALAAAAEQSAGRVERLEAARRGLEAEQRRLLQKKGQEKATPPESQRAAEEQRRRLERLEREVGDAKHAQQELTQLDRDLAKAAQDLMRELGDSAKSLESGAEDVNQMAKKQMTQKQKEQLKQQLEELRELLRQGGAGKEQHQRQLEKFAQRARGKKGSSGPGGEEPGQPGQANGNGTPRLMFGPGGQPLPVPMPGEGAAPGGSRPGSGDGKGGGREGGAGSDPNLKGPATDLDGKTEDVQAAAVDTGQGPAASEVVFGAAERGFRGSRYQKVYTQYRTVAEDVLEQDKIPAGYEFYVRRYFQLIRPRD